MFSCHSGTTHGLDVDLILPALPFGPVGDNSSWTWTYHLLSRTSKTLLVSLDWTWSIPRPAVNKEKGGFPYHAEPDPPGFRSIAHLT